MNAPRDIMDDLQAVMTDSKAPTEQRSLAQRALSEIEQLRAFRTNWMGREPPKQRVHRR
ncbi:hypothetical protein V5F77_04330 [Xanthobacter sp. DSM 24535]|uniref:hypothetical protein n=1 Tax=Roseixanthobacter psychrophilus TaxID=3119917 RepID=UPI00372A719F